jgi:hypothetical protein
MRIKLAKYLSVVLTQLHSLGSKIDSKSIGKNHNSEIVEAKQKCMKLISAISRHVSMYASTCESARHFCSDFLVCFC